MESESTKPTKERQRREKVGKRLGITKRFYPDNNFLINIANDMKEAPIRYKYHTKNISKKIIIITLIEAQMEI
jgi:hypothetical protein